VNPLFAAASDFLTFCDAHGWKCCVIGGLAVQRWGEPRQTRDVDLTLLAGLGGEEGFVDPILEHYRARFPDARRFALERRVLLVETAAGIALDISLGALPYEARLIERSSLFEVDPPIGLTHLLGRGPRRPQGIRRPPLLVFQPSCTVYRRGRSPPVGRA
jgi:hypothetical protein